MRLLLLPFLLVACSDAPADPVPETSTTVVATPEADDSQIVSTSDDSPEAADGDDLTTISGFLNAFHYASASGDTADLEPLLALDDSQRADYDEYIAPSIVRGGEWHTMAQDITVHTLEQDGDAYIATLNSETEEDGETYESALILRFAPVNGEYRMVSALMAG